MVGLDATPAMLDLAAGRGAALVCGDLERLTICDRALSGVFARHTYLHLPKDRVPGAALMDAARVLRPGGRLLATLVEGGHEGRELPGDDIPGRWFSCSEAPALEAVLGAAGFVEIHPEGISSRDGRHHDLLATAARAG